ncbi:methyltransferase domain-containing protein [Candidatus Lucifugimonas marina]|uniref:Methyltransferase domain-containing protein n=2 Tax=Candidatus Lucifugimonas marina TaxID=3038979 RepID=A0AAJ5ZE38_9CHLR|nr:methyltransferase domain-containing protein [SAR202 cluster bacterium JH702]MDG0868997.1 methyltransferase domain-containing protein [SAR202 cluster bacterium JH639]WFG35621.1 methyltransferase domain-containing protein [SAR202 cluster bacterium JH545]WFG39568.1 methyltransferase domain-containing protein [SAR202 cluster bacterium JH1073]
MTMDYVAWAEWYDIFYAAADPGDLDFYHGLCRASGGPILEIGVGTGRIALPLAKDGMEIVGIDLYEPMLKVAQQRALDVAPLDGSLKLIQADMRDFDLKRKFPVVTIPARTLLLATTEEDQIDTLCRAVQHLEEDGTMAFNLFYPDPEMLADDPDEEFLLEVVEKPDGGRYVLTAKNHFDLDSQLNHGTQIAEELDPKGEVLRRQELEVVVRYLYPEQVISMCQRVGLDVIEMWGDYEGSDLDEESDEIVVLARHSD